MALQVAVVGAGVIGTSVALHLAQSYQDQYSITIIADKLTPDTTSDKAVGMVIPFDVTPLGGSVDGIGDPAQWLRDTISHIKSLYDSPEGGEMGISLVHGIVANDSEDGAIPWWVEQTIGFQMLSQEDGAKLNVPEQYKTIVSFGAYIVDGRIYLPRLMDKFRQLGGRVLQRKVTNLSELHNYNVIINCTGLGSYSLVPDTTMYPIRGDIVSVEAPWVKEFAILHSSNDITTIYPRSHDVVLGVTAVSNDWSEESCPTTSANIIEKCSKVVPSLANAKVRKTWRCLRPGRPKIRLCCDETTPEEPIVIHCYGHEAKGVSFHWGCAVEVRKLVKSCLKTTMK